MIVSKKYKFIILHIPKTGGSTITKYFKDLKKTNAWCNNDLKIFWGIRRDDGYDMAHIRFEDVFSFYKDPDDPKLLSYKWYVIVRNPYDRIYSCYAYYKRTPSLHDDYKITMNTDTSFTAFIKQLYKTPEKWSVHTKPMTYFCSKVNIASHDIHIMRTETLDRDFKDFLNEYGLPAQYKNINVGDYSFDNPFRYKYNYNSITLECVHRLYADDFDTFGYERYINRP